MRIIMLSWEYPPNIVGGMGRHVADLSPALAQLGVEVHVITPINKLNQAKIQIEDGVHVHRVYAPPFEPNETIYNYAIKTNRYLEQYTSYMTYTDAIIHVHDWLTSFASIALKERWNCPLLATIHATERGRGRGNITNKLQREIEEEERRLTHEVDHIIVCSQPMHQEVMDYFNIPAHKTTVIPNGVSLSPYQHSEKEISDYRSRYAQNPDTLIITSVGRLVYEKGIHVLVQAMPEVLKKYPNAKLLIAGKGPEYTPLEEQIVELGLTDNVSLLGFVSDQERDLLFKIANCAAFPSLYEPFGIVALEAMVHRCPVIVSEVGGLVETVSHGETGLTTYPNQAESVAWAIDEIITHPTQAEQYAAQALNMIQTGEIQDMLSQVGLMRAALDLGLLVKKQ